MNRKELRRAMSPAGWIMLIYFLIMTACTTVAVFVETMIAMIDALLNDGLVDYYYAVEAASDGTWGYFLAAAVGILILLLWKKPRFWREEIWAKGKPMKPGDFLGLMCVFFSAQILYQIVTTATELLLNSVGFTMMEGLEMVSAGSGGFGMFLYVGILAPVAEELLCRGVVQRTLLPFGKRIAILGSAFLFAVFHGNVIQTPYAFVVGLVLGYVAAEYSLAWAMLLHMLNNLVLGEMFTLLSERMDPIAAGALLWVILLAFAVGGIVTLIRKREKIGIWLRANPLRPGYAGAFFFNAGVITFTVLMIVSMVGTCFILFTPI